jgi:hypothetical protein
MANAIRSEEYDDTLERYGLSGPQLAFKLAVIAAARDDARRAPEEPPEAEPGLSRSRVNRGEGGYEPPFGSSWMPSMSCWTPSSGRCKASARH